MDRAVFKEYKEYLLSETHSLGLKTQEPFFSLNRYDLSGEKVRVFSIELVGNEFYAIEGYLLLHRGDSIKVYKYDEKFRCTRIKSMDFHLLIFLVKKKAISRRCRLLFYNILLHLVKNNEKKYDMKLKEIMCYMCADWMVDARMGDCMVSCVYRNGESRVYNSKLQLVDENFLWKKEKSTIECKSQKIKVMKNCVEVSRNDWSFKSVFPVGEIRQYVALENSLFLLTEDSIKVLSFEG